MLILITGGAWQGKRAFAETLAKDENGDFAVMEDVHLLVKNALRQEQDPFGTILERIQSYPNVILTVNELGCGIVPVDAFDRKWRETTGRISCELAKRADAVYRVTCGIATKIK